MGTKPAPAILLTVIIQLVGVLIWSWASGQALMTYARSPEPGAAWFGSLLVGVVGAVIVGAAGLVTKLSPYGLVVVGAIHVLASLALTLMPLSVTGAGSNPMFRLTVALRRMNPQLSDGFLLIMATGTGVLLGAAMIGLGLALRARSGSSSSGGGGVGGSILAGVIAAVVTLGLLGAGGWTYRQLFMYVQSSPMSVAIGLLCAAVVGVCFATMRTSRAGGVVVGAALIVVGLTILTPRMVVQLGLPTQLLSGIMIFLSTGGLILCGAAIVVLSLTARPAQSPIPWHPADAQQGDQPTWR